LTVAKGGFLFYSFECISWLFMIRKSFSSCYLFIHLFKSLRPHSSLLYLVSFGLFCHFYFDVQIILDLASGELLQAAFSVLLACSVVWEHLLTF
jgi:hypothetical protein